MMAAPVSGSTTWVNTSGMQHMLLPAAQAAAHIAPQHTQHLETSFVAGAVQLLSTTPGTGRLWRHALLEQWWLPTQHCAIANLHKLRPGS
jgi:hypothetical protein